MRKPIAVLFKESFEFSLIASRLSARYSAGTSSMGNPDSALRLFRSVMSLTPFWVLAILGTISQKQAIRNLTGDMNRSSIEGIRLKTGQQQRERLRSAGISTGEAMLAKDP
jgi:hypothetical protein